MEEESVKSGTKRKNRRGTNPEFIAQMGKGKPKGCVSKFTDLKTAFLHAFEEIGHEDALVEYARTKKGKAHFFEMIAKMLPREIDAKVGHSGQIQVLRPALIKKPPDSGISK